MARVQSAVGDVDETDGGRVMEPYEKLEQEFGKWIDNPNVAVCSTGTAALHLAFESLGLPKCSQVIVPQFTFIACARAVTMAGLTPVFADCGDDLLIDTRRLYERVPKARAILAVPIYGRLCDMNAIFELAYKHQKRTPDKPFYIIEDCAESHGALHGNENMVTARCWSFYKNKIIAGEEGGAVCFPRSPKMLERAKSMRSQGHTRIPWMHHTGANNYRMTNAQAILISQSLLHYNFSILMRQETEKWYDELCPAEWKMPPRQVPWVYDLRIPGMQPDEQDVIVKALNEAGIVARHGFKPMTMQPEYKDHRGPRGTIVNYRAVGSAVGESNAERASREVIYLPISADMTQERIKQAWGIIQQHRPT